MDVIKDLTQFSGEPFLKSLSPASTGDIPPSPPRLDDERVEVPVPKSHSLPASPTQHILAAVPHHHSIIPDVPSYYKENSNKDALNFSISKSPELIASETTAATATKINPPADTQIRPTRAAPISPSTPSSRNNSHQQFCLRWNNYQTNLTNVFDELLQSESFVDVTLACEGQSIKAHKMVLSACSPYFQSLFYDNPCQHPIVIMRDVGWNELKAIMEFMYKGEINVSQDQINPLLKVAEMLKIRGLAEVNTSDTAEDISAMASATLVTDGGVNSSSFKGEEAVTATRRSPPSPKKPRLHVNTEKLLEVNLSSAGGRKRSRSSSPASVSEHSHLQQQQKQQQQQQHQHQQKEKQNQMQHEQQQSQHQYQARHQLPPQECPSPSMSSSSVRNPFASPIPPHSSSSSSQAPNLSSVGNGGGGGGSGSNSGGAGGGNGTSGGGGGSGGAGYPIATPPAAESMSLSALGINHVDELEIKPEIAEMIREEERAKLIEGAHPWMNGPGSSSVADSYQYQLQSMWQKCWNTNQQSLVQQLRFRERGPLKSWRPESMAEAIFSVLKEGLSLSQAARKYDIPYPTFVLYANRVHNMLGPSLDGGTDPRPKARGRPQRILLGMWPEELIRSVIKAVVFRDYREIKEETVQMYANGGGGGAAAVAHSYGMPGTPSNGSSSNGYHNKLGHSSGTMPDASSPLSTMAETLRRQIQMSQQSASPSLNMYKSPAFLQRSEMEDPMSKRNSAEHHLSNSKMADNLPDLSALGLMGIPGLNVIPQGRGQHQLSHQQQQQQHLQQNSSYSSRELKETMQQHMSNAMSQAAAAAAAVRPQLPYGQQQRSGNAGSSSNPQHKPTSSSPFSLNYKSKGDSLPYKFPDKRMLEGLTPGIDFEAIANGLLQKSHKASPRFEDFFPGPDVSDLFAANQASEAAAGFPMKDHPIAKIKLEQQHHTSDNHEE